LAVTFAMSTLAIIVTGILFQIGPVLGVSYRQARMVLPRLFIGLVFATIAPVLLQLSVDLADALTQAFYPDSGLLEVFRLSTSLLIVATIRAMLLLTVVVIFVMRDVYLLFAAAISPLIALAWVFPQTKRYADAFIGAWWAALAIGPLDILVLRLTLNLLETNGDIPHWIWAIGGLTLLVAVPYMIYSASQAIVGQATAAAYGGVKRAENAAGRYMRKRRQKQRRDRRDHAQNQEGRQRGGRRQRGPRDDNKFSEYVDDSYWNKGGRYP